MFILHYFSARTLFYRWDNFLLEYLDGSDEIAMEAASGAREPRQVSLITCSFAGPTSGTVARSHSSLD